MVYGGDVWFMAQPLVFSGEVLVSRLVTREQYVPKWFSWMEMAI
jgi:hypothetical protein